MIKKFLQWLARKRGKTPASLQPIILRSGGDSLSPRKPERQDAADKGEFEGSCNITRCQRPNSATWFNHSTRKYYCRSCAHDLNYDSFNRREALEMWGHLLCTEGKYDPDADYRKLHEERAARKDAP